MAAQERQELSSPMTENGRASLQLSDCLCPICMSILIEPVTMPCSHELCMPCFRQNVEEANLTCPLCRIRISSWARKQARENRLINQKRWKSIQESFPEMCRRRLEGLEDESFEEDFVIPHVPHISQPGEVRKEYEEQLNRLKRQKLQEEEKEMQASAELIRRLQEEEEKVIEERRRRLEVQQLLDEELARKLSANVEAIGGRAPAPVSVSSNKEDIVKLKPIPVPLSLSDEELAKKLNDEINHIPPGDEELARKLQQEMNQVAGPSQSPQTVPKSASKKSCGSTKKVSRSSSSGKDSAVSIQTFFAKAANKSTSPPSQENFAIRSTTSSSGGSSCIFVECTSEPLPSRSSSENTESIGFDAYDGNQTKTLDNKKDSDCATPGKTAPSGGISRSVSTDSISIELNHFKPIHSSPRTPPKRHTDGTLKSPVVIHSTPRNLQSKFDNQKDENEWLLRSPLVMTKWLSLVEERKRNVENQSKGTMTASERTSPHVKGTMTANERMSPHPVWVNGRLNIESTRNVKPDCVKNTTCYNANKRKASATVTSEHKTQTSKHSPPSKQERLIDFKLGDDCHRKSLRRTLLKIPANYQVEDSDEEMPPVLQIENSKIEKQKPGRKAHPLVQCEGAVKTELSAETVTKSDPVTTRRRRFKSGNVNNNNSGVTVNNNVASNSQNPPTKQTRGSKVRTIDSMFAQNRNCEKSQGDLDIEATCISPDTSIRKIVRKGSSDKSKPISPRTPRKSLRYNNNEDSPRKKDRVKGKDKTKDDTPQKNNNNSAFDDLCISPKGNRQVNVKTQSKAVKNTKETNQKHCARKLDIERKSTKPCAPGVEDSCKNTKRGTGTEDDDVADGSEETIHDGKTIAANPQPLHNSTNITRHKRHASGNKGNKNKRAKVDALEQRTLEQFTNAANNTLSQDEIDFQIALKLQKQFDSEQQEERRQINRGKGSKDAYMLRQTRTKSDSSVWVT